MKKHFVFGYVNPDTDGVASSIGYAEYLQKVRNVEATPIVLGETNSETNYALSVASLPVPSKVLSFSKEDILYVVDTHQVNQLPGDMPFESVVEIFDHHPTGNPDVFSNAKIINEKIGAVATLIAEKFLEAKITPSKETALVLYAAIISNTLDFKAPTTTQRDRDASRWLETICSPADDFKTKMFEARSDITSKSTKDVLLSDYKEFNFSGTAVGIPQLETTALDAFLKREDLLASLDQIAVEKNLNYVFFNGADIINQSGVLVSTNTKMQKILELVVPGAQFKGELAHINRILLRKSDLIPQLTEYFKNL